MTEGSFEDGNCLVRVRAQVMTRDDSTGGWVPMGGGGLSNVSVRKRLLSADDDSRHEYQICGRRINDQSVVLSCSIRKDFQYNKVMPTFHHWRTGDKKFGLTFQTSADARAFDKAVRMAMEDLLDGTGDSTHINDSDVGDDDVFMTLELPVDSRSSSGSSSGSGHSSSLVRPSSTSPSFGGDSYPASSPYTHPHANHHHLHRMHFLRPPRPTHTNGECHQESIKKESSEIEILSGEPYSYVQFAKDKAARTDHEYSYPVMETVKGSRDSMGSLKKAHHLSIQPPLLPTKSRNKKKDRRRDGKKSGRVQCRHCLEVFCEDENGRGSCEYAPDGVLSCINTTTCISCAQCMLYHCMADAEGDYSHHPCSCDGRDCRRRWAGLALLSILVPCLWCYLPLRACHKAGVGCGLCGGRHEAV